jgi:hypothetical protein
MKPGHIRVFDGLRITTGHLNHLQAGIQSSFEDLRSIVGTGPVRGMSVSIAEDKVTMQPGLAIDGSFNRIVSDDPLTQPVAFASGDTEKYVVVKYQAVEDGIVEGQPTLIFDSCVMSILDAPPDPKDNFVVIAKLVKTDLGVSVEPSGESVKDAGPVPDSKPALSSPALQVAQGVIRLDGTQSDLIVPTDPETLGEQELSLQFSALSISALVLISADVKLATESDTGAPTEFHIECSAGGEATIGATSIDQFSISNCPASDFSESDLARLFLTPPEAAKTPALGNLYLGFRLKQAQSGALKVSCVIQSASTLDSEASQAIAVRKPSVSWRALLAWKALGVSAVK